MNCEIGIKLNKYLLSYFSLSLPLSIPLSTHGTLELDL